MGGNFRLINCYYLFTSTHKGVTWDSIDFLGSFYCYCPVEERSFCPPPPHHQRMVREHRFVVVDQCPNKRVRECNQVFLCDLFVASLLVMNSPFSVFQSMRSRVSFGQEGSRIETLMDKEFHLIVA